MERLGDFLFVSGHKVYIFDLKYGKGVPVTTFNQHRVYALGALQEFGWLYTIDTFHLWVVQPRIDNIVSETITIDGLVDWYAEKVMPAIDEIVENDEPRRIPGEEQCRWCKAKGSCEALAKHNLALAVDGFDNVDQLVPVPRLPQPGDLTPAQISLILDNRKLFKSWLDAVEAHSTALLMEGGEIPNYKVVEGKSNRKWSDEEAAEKYLKRKLGVTKAFKKSLLSLTEAEKLLGKKDKKILELTKKPPGKPTLAKADDKRAAIDHARDFENI